MILVERGRVNRAEPILLFSLYNFAKVMQFSLPKVDISGKDIKIERSYNFVS